MKLKNFQSKHAIIKSWNNTIVSRAIIVFPKNITELKKLVQNLKKNEKELFNTYRTVFI